MPAGSANRAPLCPPEPPQGSGPPPVRSVRCAKGTPAHTSGCDSGEYGSRRPPAPRPDTPGRTTALSRPAGNDTAGNRVHRARAEPEAVRASPGRLSVGRPTKYRMPAPPWYSRIRRRGTLPPAGSASRSIARTAPIRMRARAPGLPSRGNLSYDTSAAYLRRAPEVRNTVVPATLRQKTPRRRTQPRPARRQPVPSVPARSGKIPLPPPRSPLPPSLFPAGRGTPLSRGRKR